MPISREPNSSRATPSRLHPIRSHSSAVTAVNRLVRRPRTSRSRGAASSTVARLVSWRCRARLWRASATANSGARRESNAHRGFLLASSCAQSMLKVSSTSARNNAARLVIASCLHGHVVMDANSVLARSRSARCRNGSSRTCSQGLVRAKRAIGGDPNDSFSRSNSYQHIWLRTGSFLTNFLTVNDLCKTRCDAGFSARVTAKSRRPTGKRPARAPRKVAMPATCTDWTALQRAEGLPPASFGFRLSADTLAIGWALPADGHARDFHPLGVCACSAHNGGSRN